MHFTLRRTLLLLFQPRFWGAVLSVSLVLGIAGPFGTYEHLDLLPRLAYWFAIALLTFLVGFATVVLTLHRLPDREGWRYGRLAVAALLAGVPITAVIVAFNAVLFGEMAAAAEGIPGLYLNCCLIAAAVTFLSTLMDGHGRAGANELTGGAEGVGTTAAAHAPARPAASPALRPKLLDRLPTHLRGSLVRLAMQDHYVEVFTDKGSTLVLMRLADAIAETAPVEGLQVHRSHWVARTAVAGAARQDGKPVLRLADGTLLPVSRTYLASVKSAGWQ